MTDQEYAGLAVGQFVMVKRSKKLYRLRSVCPRTGLRWFVQWQVNEKFPQGREYQADRNLKADAIEFTDCDDSSKAPDGVQVERYPSPLDSAGAVFISQGDNGEVVVERGEDGLISGFSWTEAE